MGEDVMQKNQRNQLIKNANNCIQHRTNYSVF